MTRIENERERTGGGSEEMRALWGVFMEPTIVLNYAIKN